MSARAWCFALPLGFLAWAAILIGGAHVHGAAKRGELIVLNLGGDR